MSIQCFLALLLSSAVAGQTFSVPQIWRVEWRFFKVDYAHSPHDLRQEPNSTLPRSVREGLANTVVGTLVPLFDPYSGRIPSMTCLASTRAVTHRFVSHSGLIGQGDQSAYLMAAISRTDYLSGNKSFQNLVLANMDAAFKAGAATTT